MPDGHVDAAHQTVEIDAPVSLKARLSQCLAVADQALRDGRRLALGARRNAMRR